MPDSSRRQLQRLASTNRRLSIMTGRCIAILPSHPSVSAPRVTCLPYLDVISADRARSIVQYDCARRWLVEFFNGRTAILQNRPLVQRSFIGHLVRVNRRRLIENNRSSDAIRAACAGFCEIFEKIFEQAAPVLDAFAPAALLVGKDKDRDIVTVLAGNDDVL